MITWMPTTNQIAQASHFFIATTIVAVAFIFGCSLPICFLFVLLWALPKEFIFDLVVEQDTLADSEQDFSWYVIGGIVGVAFLFIRSLMV